MKPGAAVNLTGNFIPSRGRGQLYDFIPEKVEIIGEMDSEVWYGSSTAKTISQTSSFQSYPIGGKERREEGEYRPHLHLRPRLMSFAATLRLRSFAKNWLHQYMLVRIPCVAVRPSSLRVTNFLFVGTQFPVHRHSDLDLERLRRRRRSLLCGGTASSYSDYIKLRYAFIPFESQPIK